jgi:hypothetical protein
MKFLSIVYTILLIAGCSQDSDTGLDGTTGIVKFSFESEPALAGYSFSISSEKNGDVYLITNTDSLPKATDVTKLKATFQSINSLVQVKVNGAIQKSGSTVNDFSKPLLYDVFAENGNLKKYKVMVNVAKRNIATEKYIFINQSSYQESEVQAIYSKFGGQSNRKVAVGLGVIISVLNGEPYPLGLTVRFGGRTGQIYGTGGIQPKLDIIPITKIMWNGLIGTAMQQLKSAG